MEFPLLLAGLGLALGGAVLAAIGDVWLSRSILVYLDAVENNLGKVIEMLQGASTNLVVTGVDLKRDRGQNRARFLKTFGWLFLVLGFALQVVTVWLFRRPV